MTAINDEKLRGEIKNLLESQLLAVLSTQRRGQPYSNLIAFAHSSDLKTLLFATPKQTRKFENLLAEPRVSLLIDSRSNSEADFHGATAVTVIGSVEEVTENEPVDNKLLYLSKHPYLSNFVNSPSTVFLKVNVERYIMVTRFQTVMELCLSDAMDIFA